MIGPDKQANSPQNVPNTGLTGISQVTADLQSGAIKANLDPYPLLTVPQTEVILTAGEKVGRFVHDFLESVRSAEKLNRSIDVGKRVGSTLILDRTEIPGLSGPLSKTFLPLYSRVKSDFANAHQTLKEDKLPPLCAGKTGVAMNFMNLFTKMLVTGGLLASSFQMISGLYSGSLELFHKGVYLVFLAGLITLPGGTLFRERTLGDCIGKTPTPRSDLINALKIPELSEARRLLNQHGCELYVSYSGQDRLSFEAQKVLGTR